MATVRRLACIGVLAAAVLAGCSHGDAAKEEVIHSTLWVVQDDLESWCRLAPESRPVSWDYLLSRGWDARDFLRLNPALDVPYVVSAVLGEPSDEQDEGEYMLRVSWLEYDTHAMGLLFTEKWPDGYDLPRAPIFEWECGLRAADPQPRRTAYLTRFVRVVLASEGPLEVRKKASPLPQLLAPLVLCVPVHLLRDDLEMGVYDERGMVSTNLAPLFVTPEIRKVIAGLRKAAAENPAPSS